MNSEEIKETVFYIQGLQALWKGGYNAEKVGDYTFRFLRRDYDISNELWDVIDELQFMGEGKEWELPEEEVATLIHHKLGIDIYDTMSILSYTTKCFIKQLVDNFSTDKVVLSLIEESKNLIAYKEYILALENLLKSLLERRIFIPRDTLAILDTIEDTQIQHLQQALWKI